MFPPIGNNGTSANTFNSNYRHPKNVSHATRMLTNATLLASQTVNRTKSLSHPMTSNSLQKHKPQYPDLKSRNISRVNSTFNHRVRAGSASFQRQHSKSFKSAIQRQQELSSVEKSNGRISTNSHKEVLARKKRVANGDKVPQSADLSRTVVSFSSNSGRCSGFFLNHDLVATNRHCIYKFKNNDTQIHKSQIDAKNYNVLFKGNRYPCLELIFFNDSDYCIKTSPDIALCKLSYPILGSMVFPLFNGTSEQVNVLKDRSTNFTFTADSFAVGDGAVICKDDSKTKGTHTGHRIAWHSLNFKYPSLTSNPTKLPYTATPHPNKIGNFQNICPGDSGSAMLVANTESGRFELAGIVYSSALTARGKTVDNDPRNTWYEVFCDKNISKWIHSHYRTDGIQYYSSMDSILLETMPRFKPHGVLQSEWTNANKFTYNLELGFSTWALPSVFAELAVTSKIYDINGKYRCMSFTNFPCSLVIDGTDIDGHYQIGYAGHQWSGNIIYADTNFLLTSNLNGDSYNLKITSKAKKEIDIPPQPTKTTPALKQESISLKKNSVLIIKNSRANCKVPFIMIVSYLNASNKQVNERYKFDCKIEKPIPIPLGAKNITIKQIVNKKIVYSNSGIANRFQDGNCLKFIFTNKKVPTITSFCN